MSQPSVSEDSLKAALAERLKAVFVGVTDTSGERRGLSARSLSDLLRI